MLLLKHINKVCKNRTHEIDFEDQYFTIKLTPLKLNNISA